MYRYLVFVYEVYYPMGGMNDCVFKTNDYEEAKKHLESSEYDSVDYKEIYDVQEDRVETL